MPDWFVYVIQSELDGSFYTGHTHDPQLRVIHHNDGWTRSTKGKRPWKLLYTEHYGSKAEAVRRELQIKRMKSREYIERIIRHAGGRPDPDSTLTP
jgi:putative endonuclease